MTNRQVLEGLDTKTFLQQMRALFQNPFAQYIAFDEYLDSEDINLLHFIKHKGKCVVKPSEMELKVNANAECNENCLLLGETQLCGDTYAIVADLSHNRLIKVPNANVVREVYYV